MRSSTRARLVTLTEYLSSGVAVEEPDWGQVAKDAAELAAIARAEVEIGAVRGDPPPAGAPPAGLAAPAQLLTIKQVGEVLGVHEHTVRRQIRRGALVASKPGGLVIRVRSEDLEAYVAAAVIEPDAPVSLEVPPVRARAAKPDGPGSIADLDRIEREMTGRAPRRRGR